MVTHASISESDESSKHLRNRTQNVRYASHREAHERLVRCSRDTSESLRRWILMDIKGIIAATVLQPGSSTLASATESILAPLPVAGPEGRLYFAKHRVYVDGNIKGMYFFG